MALIHNAGRPGKVHSLPVLAGEEGIYFSSLLKTLKPVFGG